MTNLIDIIREAGILDKVAFGDVDNYPKLARMQGAKPKSEPNTSFEDRLYDILQSWVGSPDNGIFAFQSSMPILAKQYPAIFKPETPIGTILYRGLNDVSNKTKSYLLKNSTLADWVPMREDYWLCKVPIQYVPHYKAQSWTDKLSVAQKFASDGVLITKQDANFYMNKRALTVMYGENEHEIIHFGKEFQNPVYIAVDDNVYQDDILLKMQSAGKKIGFKDLATFYKSNKK